MIMHVVFIQHSIQLHLLWPICSLFFPSIFSSFTNFSKSCAVKNLLPSVLRSFMSMRGPPTGSAGVQTAKTSTDSTNFAFWNPNCHSSTHHIHNNSEIDFHCNRTKHNEPKVCTVCEAISRVDKELLDEHAADNEIHQTLQSSHRPVDALSETCTEHNSKCEPEHCWLATCHCSRMCNVKYLSVLSMNILLLCSNTVTETYGTITGRSITSYSYWITVMIYDANKPCTLLSKWS